MSWITKKVLVKSSSQIYIYVNLYLDELGVVEIGVAEYVIL